MKSGFVAILGKSNVGKSTLINKIIASKISIVTSKSQTTRNAIKGIYNDEESQIVFIDTPGFHNARAKLDEEMNNMAANSTLDADAILYVIDVSDKRDNDPALDKLLSKNKLPLIIVYNKIDLIRIDEMAKIKAKYEALYPHAQFVEMVALEGFNVDTLIATIKSILPEGPRYYDVDILTDQDEIFRIKETIREKILKILREEVPHSIAIYMANIEWEHTPVLIDAEIVVEKESQKKIVVGKAGTKIKQIGEASRKSIEAILHKPVYLNLLVKVNSDWRNNEKALQKYGYKNKKS